MKALLMTFVSLSVGNVLRKFNLLLMGPVRWYTLRML